MFRTFDGWAAAERSGSHVSTCEPLHEHLHVLGLRWEGGISVYLRFLARRASDRKRGRDGTAYSDYHASGGFLAHHLARISMAAVYWDAQHIDEGVRFLKQHAQPHA